VRSRLREKLINKCGPGFISDGDDEVWVVDGELRDQIIVHWKGIFYGHSPERLKLGFDPHRPLVGRMTPNEQRAVTDGMYPVVPVSQTTK
jgi:hypothetical protein